MDRHLSAEIDAMITDRILMYNDLLVQKGYIKNDDNTRSTISRQVSYCNQPGYRKPDNDSEDHAPLQSEKIHPNLSEDEHE